MRGAFFVGALKTIDRMLGPNYFDAIYSSSVGIFEQASFASKQIYQMEYVWREYVCGKQLINYMNPLKKRGIIDLDYLVALFQSDVDKDAKLDLKALENSHLRLFSFVADYKTKKPVVIEINHQNVFEVMRAACALPYLYTKPVIIDGKRYIDSWNSPVKEFQKFLENNLKSYDEVLLITSRARKDKRFTGIKNVIKPSKIFLWSALDTNRNRIIKTIRQGELDTEKFNIENKLGKNFD